MPRPKFSATAEQRKMTAAMMACGIPETEIAKSIGINPKTLRKHFRRELDLGAIRANTAVAQTALQMAISGKFPGMTIFWLKTRCGWCETAVLRHTGPEGGPVEMQPIQIVISPDDAKL